MNFAKYFLFFTVFYVFIAVGYVSFPEDNPDEQSQEALYEGITLSRRGETAGAIEQFNKVTRDFPQSPAATEALRNLAGLYLDNNDYANAIAVFKELTAKNPGVILYYQRLLELYKKSLRVDDILNIAADIRKMLTGKPQWFPEDVKLALQLPDYLRDINRNREALDLCFFLMDCYPQKINFNNFESAFYSALNNIQGALRDESLVGILKERVIKTAYKNINDKLSAARMLYNISGIGWTEEAVKIEQDLLAKDPAIFSLPDENILWFIPVFRRMFTAVSDINSDGILEVVVVTSEKARALSGKTGKEIWSYSLGKLVTNLPIISDVDADGVPDVIVSANSGSLWALEGRTGKLIWENIVSSEQPQRDLRNESHSMEPCARIFMGNINNDGIDDIIIRRSGVCFVDGRTGVVIREKHYPSGFIMLDAKDISGDGVCDVAVCGRKKYLIGVLDGKTGEEIFSGNFGEPLDEIYSCRGRICDVDCDGVSDVVFSAAPSKIVAVSLRKGLLYKTTLYPRSDQKSFTPGLYFNDFDRDGKQEILVKTGHSNTRDMFFIDASSGSVKKSISYTDSIDCVSVFDFDADGSPDIIAGTEFFNSNPAKIAAFSFKGDGIGLLWEFKQKPIGYMSLNDPASPIAADVDGDGKMEIIYSLSANLYAVKTGRKCPVNEIIADGRGL